MRPVSALGASGCLPAGRCECEADIGGPVARLPPKPSCPPLQRRNRNGSRALLWTLGVGDVPEAQDTSFTCDPFREARYLPSEARYHLGRVRYQHCLLLKSTPFAPPVHVARVGGWALATPHAAARPALIQRCAAVPWVGAGDSLFEVSCLKKELAFLPPIWGQAGFRLLRPRSLLSYRPPILPYLPTRSLGLGLQAFALCRRLGTCNDSGRRIP